jgi:hypothetical protein
LSRECVIAKREDQMKRFLDKKYVPLPAIDSLADFE